MNHRCGHHFRQVRAVIRRSAFLGRSCEAQLIVDHQMNRTTDLKVRRSAKIQALLIDPLSRIGGISVYLTKHFFVLFSNKYWNNIYVGRRSGKISSRQDRSRRSPDEDDFSLPGRLSPCRSTAHFHRRRTRFP